MHWQSAQHRFEASLAIKSVNSFLELLRGEFDDDDVDDDPTDENLWGPVALSPLLTESPLLLVTADMDPPLILSEPPLPLVLLLPIADIGLPILLALAVAFEIPDSVTDSDMDAKTETDKSASNSSPLIDVMISGELFSSVAIGFGLRIASMPVSRLAPFSSPALLEFLVILFRDSAVKKWN